MIPFDDLRTVLLAADPYGAMDALIRRELTAGRRTSAIYDELVDHVEAVRTLPEYTDDVENNLGDTLDALCGWCHRDYAYQDPPEPGAPTLPSPGTEANRQGKTQPARSTPPA